MKKVLLSLLAVAALVLSCQNYDDEFAALNTKISSLESQINSLAELRTAVTGVQSSVAALQSAVAASNTALTASIEAISADLVNLQSAIDAAATDADLTALKTELTTTLAALQTLIETNSASIASLVTSNSDLRAALDALGVDVTSILASNATFEGELNITNAAELAYAKSLGNKVSTIKGNVYVLVDVADHTGGGDGTGLSASDVNSVTKLITYVVGNVKIVADELVDLSALASVSGDYIVKGFDANDDSLIAVGGDVLFDYDGAYSSKIQTASNIYLVAKASVKAAAGVVERTGTTSIDFLALTKATGVQTVSQANANSHTSGSSISFVGNSLDTKTISVEGSNSTTTTAGLNATTSIKIGQAPVVSVQGKDKLATIELHYAADYVAVTNTSGSAALSGVNISATSATSVTVMAATVTGNVVLDVTPSTTLAGLAVTAGRSVTVSFPNLVSAGGFSSDALDNAALASLKTLGSGGLTLAYQESVSLPALVSSTGDISLSKATSLTASKLARVGSATATGAGANITAEYLSGVVSLPALTKAGAITMNSASTFSAPLAKISAIDIEELSGTTVVTTIDVASISTFASTPLVGTVTGPSTVSILKLSAQDAQIQLWDFTNATSITLVGKATSTGAPAISVVRVGSENSKLKTLTLGGVLSTVVVDTNNSVGGTQGATAPAPVADAATGTATAEGTNAGTALTTITTSGTIASIEIANNYDLTTANLNHTDSTTGSLASVIIVDNNPNLATLTTGVKHISNLTISENYKLSSLNLSSITSLPTNFTYGTTTLNIDIVNNYIDKATAGYTAVYGRNAFGPSVTAPLSTFAGLTGEVVTATATSDRQFKQTGLATLKPFFEALNSVYWTAAARVSGTVAQNQTGVTIDMDYVYQDTTPNDQVQQLDGIALADFDELLDLQ